jgi:lipopolysaccharide transport system ATP-binding protein
MSALLHLSGVGKDYAKLDANAGRLRLVFDLLRGRGAPQVFQALDEVSFDLAAGESLGIIGENGAGKSTLLKIVAGVITPTRGVVESRGRVGALLELGSGFHPEYSGIANIDLAAALLGLTRAEIAAKRDQIIAFADIGEHIHDPIKHYSSGMVVRLGFAVATALTPDILITDEVLAVGDESFQKKCVAWMERYLVGGGTLLLCSHSMYHIQKLCRAALWLKDGRVERYGAAAEVSQAYLAYHEEKSAGAKQPIAAPTAAAAGVYAVQSLTLDLPATVPSGGALTIAGRCSRPTDVRRWFSWLGPRRRHAGVRCGHRHGRRHAEAYRRASFRFFADLSRLPLLPGKYLVRAHALDPEGVRLFDNVEMPLLIEGATREMGLVRIDHDWSGRTADSGSPDGAGPA